jgi:hypothetical protein
MATQDSFVGRAITTHSYENRFDMRSGPSGENPMGTGVTSDWVCCSYPITPIVCLAVTGNKATCVAALGQVSPSTFPPTGS